MKINFERYRQDNCLNLEGKRMILLEILSNDENLDEFGLFLKNNPHITTLNLANCHIGRYKIKLLINPIYNSNITNLNVSGNMLFPAGAAEIAKLSKLITLNMSHNYTMDKGVTEIAKLSELTNLNMSDNYITYGDIEEMAKLSKLTNLNISDNIISSKGIATIMKCLKLTDINMSSSNAGVQAIDEALDSNFTLTNCNLEYNGTIDATVKENIYKKVQRNKEIKNISEAFKQIISEITLNADGTPILSLGKEDSEQNSFLKTLQEYSKKYGAFPLPVLEQIIAQSLYQDTVHVYKDGTEQLPFTTKSDALTKVTHAVLKNLGFAEENINEFNFKIVVEIIKEVNEMFLLELDILSNMQVWNTGIDSLPLVLSYHEYTIGDTCLPSPNINIELPNVLQKANDPQEIELKNNQLLASLYKQFPDLKTPGIILKRALMDILGCLYIEDIETLLKEKPYEQIFKHQPLIQDLFNEISETELQESSSASKQTASLEAILKQYFDTHPSNTNEQTQSNLDDTLDLMGNRLDLMEDSLHTN